MVPLPNARSLDIINIHCILYSMSDISVVGNDDYALALICTGLNVVDSLADRLESTADMLLVSYIAKSVM
jgi:hypothetical protein